MVKLSINRALWLFGLVQISISGLCVLSVIGPDPWMLGFVDRFRVPWRWPWHGRVDAYIAKSTNVAFAATQFALFTALAAVRER